MPTSSVQISPFALAVRRCLFAAGEGHAGAFYPHPGDRERGIATGRDESADILSLSLRADDEAAAHATSRARRRASTSSHVLPASGSFS